MGSYWTSEGWRSTPTPKSIARREKKLNEFIQQKLEEGIMPYGKYKGFLIKDVILKHFDYIMWMENNQHTHISNILSLIKQSDTYKDLYSKSKNQHLKELKKIQIKKLAEKAKHTRGLPNSVDLPMNKPVALIVKYNKQTDTGKHILSASFNQNIIVKDIVAIKKWIDKVSKKGLDHINKFLYIQGTVCWKNDKENCFALQHVKVIPKELIK